MVCCCGPGMWPLWALASGSFQVSWSLHIPLCSCCSSSLYHLPSRLRGQVGPQEAFGVPQPWGRVESEPGGWRIGFAGSSLTCLLIFRMAMCHLSLPVWSWVTSLRPPVPASHVVSGASGLGQLSWQPSTLGCRHWCPPWTVGSPNSSQPHLCPARAGVTASFSREGH